MRYYWSKSLHDMNYRFSVLAAILKHSPNVCIKGRSCRKRPSVLTSAEVTFSRDIESGIPYISLPIYSAQRIYNTAIFMARGMARALLKRRRMEKQRNGQKREPMGPSGRTSSSDNFEIELFIPAPAAPLRCDIGTADRKIRGEPDRS